MTEVSLSRLAEVVGAEIEETARAIKIALFNGVIRDTRIDTGRLRANWQTSTGAPKQGELDRTSEEAALSEVKANVTSDGVDYLTNNLPYAEVWEQKDGMVARNVARIDRNIREKIRGR